MIGRLGIVKHAEKKYDLVIKLVVLSVFGLWIALNLLVHFSSIFHKPFLLSFFVILCYFAVIYFGSKYLTSDLVALIILCIISLLVLITWNLIYRPQPISDYRYIWDGAHEILNGTFFESASEKSNYFRIYSFQIGYTYYCALFLRIYDSLVTLKIVEIITLTLVTVVLYKTLRLSHKIGESFFAAAIFAVYPFVFAGSGIINNQHIGLLLGAIAVYLCLKNDKYVTYIISAIILVIGNVLRPSTIMIFVAIAVVLFFQGFLNKKMWIKMLVFISVFFLTYKLVDFFFIFLSLAPYGLISSDLYFKLLLGLTGGGMTTKEPGHWFIVEDLKYYNYNYQQYKEACKEYLKQMFLEGKIDINYVFGKVNWYISGIDNQVGYSGVELNSSLKLWMDYLDYSGKFIYIISLLGTFFETLKKKRLIENTKFILPAFIFCAYFVIYIVFEAMPRYRFEQYYYLFILSMPTIYSMIRKGETFIKHRKIRSVAK